jgi:hypothetical protein
MAKKSTQLVDIAEQRTKKLPAYRSFRLAKKIQPDYVKGLPKVGQLWRETWAFLWKYRVRMVTFLFIYTVTYLVLVKGLSGFTADSSALRDSIDRLIHGDIAAIPTSLGLYGALIGSVSASTTDISNYYQVSILMVFSLAFIWLVRKLHGRRANVSVKDAFYVGMRPLIPFLLVTTLLIVELAPAGLGGLLLGTAQSAVVQGGSGEILAFSVIFVLCFVLTCYLLAGSVFAIYIVTLPSATPMLAVRSSMRLLRVHRWVVVRKMAGFYVLLFLLGFVLMLPFVYWLPRFVETAFFVMSCASFAVMHTFMYKLYRAMIA